MQKPSGEVPMGTVVILQKRINVEFSQLLGTLQVSPCLAFYTFLRSYMTPTSYLSAISGLDSGYYYNAHATLAAITARLSGILHASDLIRVVSP